MRRIAFLALLIVLVAPACMSPRPVPFPERPAIGRANVPGINQPPRPQPPQCVEVARFRCDARCGGYKFDYVSVQCAGAGAKSYCQANGGCRAEAAK